MSKPNREVNEELALLLVKAVDVSRLAETKKAFRQMMRDYLGGGSGGVVVLPLLDPE